MLSMEVHDMKFIITIGLCVLFLACTPGDAPSPPETAAADQPTASTIGFEDQNQSVAPAGTPEPANAESIFTSGQTLYAAVYSHVYWGRGKKHFNLACTLSIRNIDLESPIVVTAVDYYNTAGDLVRNFVDQSRTLAPLETVDFYIPEHDTTGGSGANFIVRWGSPTEINPPIVEAVMIGVDASQGISFVCPAREIKE